VQKEIQGLMELLEIMRLKFLEKFGIGMVLSHIGLRPNLPMSKFTSWRLLLLLLMQGCKTQPIAH
jgi:hypothetical protein